MTFVQTFRWRQLLAVWLFVLVSSAPAVVLAQETSAEHAEDDAYWAQKAQAYPPFEVNMDALRVASVAELSALGQWGPVLDWPHIPVTAANLPDGRVLTWASNEEDAFPSGPEYTFAAAWHPVTGAFQLVPHTSHDMFCAGQVMLEDGRVLVNGGRNTVTTTSYFDFTTNTWTAVQPMSNGRWYPTSVALANGEVMTAIGSGGGSNPEVWNETAGWRKLTGVDLSGPILNYTGHFEQNWSPLMVLGPEGDVFHAGPTPAMHFINPAATGSIQPTGTSITAWYPKDSATILYDEGRLLVAGGTLAGGNEVSSAMAATIDITGASPIVKTLAPMNFARRFSNSMVLPNGEVIVVGGNTSGIKFSDAGSVLTPEIWNPTTETWRTVADMAVPRNYHSLVLLLPDATVFVGGGGLCGTGCSANHQDAQIYSPGYLFAADGSPAVRPTITSAPVAVRNGASFTVTASAGVQSFSLVKMASVSHSINTDSRFLKVAHADLGGGAYQLTAHANQNVLTPGYWMLFALDAAGVPSEAAILQVSTEGAPDVINPGTQVSPVGQPVTLALDATDPNGDALTFSATGLPAGLSMNGAGVITGTPPQGSEGVSEVAVTVSDAGGSVSIAFSWIVTSGATGTILREYWTGITGTAVSALTSNSNYPDNPTGSDFLPSFFAPTDWADNYGTRMRGYIYPPVTGDYTFWIASDDNGQLKLSTDASAANATVIASVSGWTTDTEWTKFPEQKSALINLVAGQRYYIEALQKEGGGLDNLAVAWQIPGQSLEIIPGAYLSPYLGAPIVEYPGDQSGAEGEAARLQLSATDPDGDAVTFSATGLPAGLTLNTSTGLITGGLASGTAGTATVTVTATDGQTSGSTTFTWAIDAARGSWIDYTDDASSRLTISSVPTTDAEEKDVVTGDLDNDGWDDVVVVRKAPFMETQAKVDLLLMNESGTLVDRTTTYAPGFAARPTVARDAVIHDFDGDGWDDLVIANTFGDQPVFYRNRGNDASGNWLGLADESTLRLPTLDVGAIQYCGVSAGDIDGDGSPDLYFANYVMDGTTQDVLLMNDGTGHFTDEGDDRLGDLLNTAFGVQATIIDFDKDGDNDIVKLSAERAAQPWGADGIFILYNDGAGQFANWSTVPSSLAYMYAIGDFDDDGGYDFYVVDDEADYVNLSTGVTPNAGASFTQATTPWARTAGHGANLRLGDLDGDGDLDIGVADVDTSFPPCDPGVGSFRSFVILENEGDATGTFIDPFGAADKPWSENLFDFAFIDINNDGNLDIFSARCSGYGVYVSTQEPASNPVTLALGDMNLGIAGIENPTGTGYMMYSEESVHTRFAANATSTGNADHLINVKYINGAWNYDNNKKYYVFTPRPSDRLLAELSFANDGVTMLQGAATTINGIYAGYIASDLVITPDRWGGAVNNGEYGVAGTYVTIAGSDDGMNTPPMITGIADQTHVVGAAVSLAVEVVDTDGDALTFSATGLPDGVSINGTTGAMSGTLATVGMYTVTVTVSDGKGGSDSDTFSWTVDAGDPTGSVVLTLTPFNLGIGAQESASGVGYIMYSAESVHTRFSANAPSTGNANHLIAVKFTDGVWKYDNNKKYYTFTPAPGDRLLAEVQNSTDVVTMLEGVNTVVNGIPSGYLAGDFTVIANQWGGVFNDGEFGLTGSFVEVPGSASSKQQGAYDLFASVTTDASGLPEQFALGAVYPNPFRAQTSIEYALPEASTIQLEIYNVTGQRVRALIDGIRVPAGFWRLEWDGHDDGGREVASGVYIIRFQAGAFAKTGKVVVVR